MSNIKEGEDRLMLFAPYTTTLEMPPSSDAGNAIETKLYTNWVRLTKSMLNYH
jgi:hypothetical protein